MQLYYSQLPYPELSFNYLDDPGWSGTLNSCASVHFVQYFLTHVYVYYWNLYGLCFVWMCKDIPCPVWCCLLCIFFCLKITLWLLLPYCFGLLKQMCFALSLHFNLLKYFNVLVSEVSFGIRSWILTIYLLSQLLRLVILLWSYFYEASIPIYCTRASFSKAGCIYPSWCTRSFIGDPKESIFYLKIVKGIKLY